MTNEARWNKVNRDLVAKSIGELHFEEVLKSQRLSDKWVLSLQNGVTYTFDAWETVWTHLRVDPESLRRNGEPVNSAATFFIDTQTETGMDDITLGNFLEEMHNTLYSDLQLQKSGITSKELAFKRDEELQALLSGHPKILLNKGRMGWGSDALSKFAPESGAPFQLHWMALVKELVSAEDFDYLECSFSEAAKKEFLAKVGNKLSDPADYHIIPVHPWQWERIISLQFAGLVARGELIYLGAGGDYYRPQVSIRTLSNMTQPRMPDIKLPVSILNTSCVRGITASTINHGKKVSSILQEICSTDPLLKLSGTEVLQEKAGLAFIHPDYGQIKAAPYRYHEYFGVIVRESTFSKLSEDESAMITAALFHQDENKNSLIGSLIERSGLSKEQWLRSYFRSVVIPLYHLQLHYGIGMVAHGQNIVLKLRNAAPVGMFIKDFQGDLRLSQSLPPDGRKFFGGLSDELTSLPPHYLIHDLITGHFITVLRFISATMKECDSYPEEEFYRILSSELQAYLKERNVPEGLDLLAPYFQKVLLNKVRFKIGYGDSSERPLPLTGTQLRNPLFPGNFA